MNNNFQVLNPGIKDSLDILTPAEELLVEGGRVTCAKGYSITRFGDVNCECGYLSDEEIL